LEDDIPENKFSEPVLPDLVLDGSKMSSQPSHMQPLMREQQFTKQRQRQKNKDPERAAKIMSQPFVIEEQVRHQQQVPLRKHFQKEQDKVQDVNKGSHPSLFLNQLSPELQQLFLDQFLSLTPEHQEYVYQKFLSAAPETQQFAIQQFLSLDHRILVVSIQAEMDREAALQTDQGMFENPELNFPSRKPSPSFGNSHENEPLRKLEQFARKPNNIDNLNPDSLSISELRSLQEQRQQEEQQQQLQAIIETQHSLNQRG
jgi:hypothetical protein